MARMRFIASLFFRRVAEKLEALLQNLQAKVKEASRSRLVVAATRVFTNLRLAAPGIDLCWLVVEVPAEAPEL